MPLNDHNNIELVPTATKVPVPFVAVFGLQILILPHMVDGAGAFAHVKAGGESAR